jgi:CMP-N-acetylneuraminic acid synthetase
MNSKLRYGGNIGMIEMPLHRSFQIDTYDDLLLMEKILKNEITTHTT